MTPQELKNSILQRAIEGKLVEQRAEEGSGEELYKVIQAEKKKLIKEGKIKKQKALPEIKEDEMPFEIPESWKWVRLGNIVSLLGDGLHGTPKYDINGSYYFINGNNLVDGKIFITDRTKKVNENEWEKYKKPLDDSSVLVSINGTIGNLSFYNSEKVVLGKSACYFNLVFPDLKYYIYYVLKSAYFLKHANKNATGTTIKNLSLKVMRELVIPIPPLNEQKRIVEKIEELMLLVEAYEESWKRLEELNKKFPEDMKKSLLQEAIKGKLVEQRAEEGTGEELYETIQAEKKKLIKEGKIKKQKALPEITEGEIPFEIPENWKWVRLGEIGEWGAGSTPSRSNPKFYGGKIPWLKTGDLNDSYITDVPEHITDLALNSTSLKLNPVNSVLIAMYGATIGKLGILKKPMTTNQACCACQPINGIYNLYLFYFLMVSRRRLTKMAEGGAQPNISRTKIISVTMPLPPLNEQKRIVERLEKLLPLCDQLMTRETERILNL